MNKFYLIKEDNENTRVDRWFKRNINDVPQSLIEKILRKGKLKVNNRKVKNSYKLKINDKVKVYDLNFVNKKNKVAKVRYVASKKEISSSHEMFIENNDNFVVINKPAGIAVQSGTKSKRNLIDLLRNTIEFKDCTPFIVHRIDKETTGILIVAKNRKYAQLFTSLFRIRKIHKTYLGIVLGEVENKKGTYTDFLTSYEGEKKVNVKAITHFSIIDVNNNYSLLKLNPETGRKHQLRKQLLIHGHPILGDTKYRFLSSRPNKSDKLMLHASKIKFSIAGVRYNFFADTPEAFKKNLKEKFLKIL